jgi:hypothetical protein
MNITLSVDERVAEAAREAARKMGKSLNQAVRDYLEQLAGQERQTAEWQAWEQRCLGSVGRLNGWKFDRDTVHDRG